MKMRLLIVPSALLYAAALAACSGPHATVKKLGKGDPNQAETYLATFDATARASVVHVNQNRAYILAEAPPDAIITSVSEVLGKLNYGKGENAVTAEAQARLAESVTALGKRTAAVNILRDALYRLAEMKQNGALAADEKALFTDVLDAAVKIATAEELENRAKLFVEFNKALESMKHSGASDADIKGFIKKNAQ